MSKTCQQNGKQHRPFRADSGLGLHCLKTYDHYGIVQKLGITVCLF